MSATLEIIKEPVPFMPENVIGLLISNAEYTPHVEFGTKPHDIEVKNKMILATTKGRFKRTSTIPLKGKGQKGLPRVSTDGRYAILGKRVKHPGTKAQPFLRPAVLKTIKKFPKYFLNEILKKNPNLRKVMHDFLFLAVVPQSIKLAPVDIGILRRGITSEVL